MPPSILSTLVRVARAGALRQRGLAGPSATSPLEPLVHYGYAALPEDPAGVNGGLVKLHLLNAVFPDAGEKHNILYLANSRLPLDAVEMARKAQLAGARVVLNQNGVAYPVTHGAGWEESNLPNETLLHIADYVLFQSHFCKLAADRYLGERTEACEVLHNAVDTQVFTPGERPAVRNGLMLLLGGQQWQWARLRSALAVLAELIRIRPDARLIVAGALSWLPDHDAAERIARETARELGVSEHVTFSGAYTRRDAPALFRRADVLLHTMYADPCPSVVLEAMACGLPVVYSASGGTPELVGPDAGIGIPVELSWEHDVPVDPFETAEAIVAAASERERYARAGRRRAVESFDLRQWFRRHREVFEELLQSEPGPPASRRRAPIASEAPDDELMTCVNFGEATHLKYLDYGWSSEAPGISSAWTLARSASLIGRLPKTDSLRLSVRMRNTHAGQRVEVRLNGVDMGSWDVQDDGAFHEYHLPLDPSLVREADVDRVEFRIARTAPVTSDDPRSLGVSAEWARIVAA